MPFKTPLKRLRLPRLPLFFMMSPAIAQANVIWPVSILEERILSWWAILIGIVVEFLVVRRMIAMTPKRCLTATLAMNAVSTIAGCVLIPLGGILIEAGPGTIFYYAFNIGGRYNPYTWLLTVIAAAAINSGIEIIILRRFTRSIPGKTMFGRLFVANMISVGLAAGSMVI